MVVQHVEIIFNVKRYTKINHYYYYCHPVRSGLVSLFLSPYSSERGTHLWFSQPQEHDRRNGETSISASDLVHGTRRWAESSRDQHGSTNHQRPPLCRTEWVDRSFWVASVAMVIPRTCLAALVDNLPRMSQRGFCQRLNNSVFEISYFVRLVVSPIWLG